MKYLFIPNDTRNIDDKKNDLVREKYNNACALPFCRSNVNTEIHHIVPKKEAKVKFGDVDYLPNLVLLCRPHHMEAEDNSITRKYLVDISEQWNLNLVIENTEVLQQQYNSQKLLFDSKKSISVGNMNSFHEQIIYVNAVSLSTHIRTFQQNLGLIEKNNDPESAFNYYMSFASSCRRHSAQTSNRIESKKRLTLAIQCLKKCRILIDENGLSQVLLNKVVYEEAYVKYFLNEENAHKNLSVYEDAKENFSNYINRYFLYIIRGERLLKFDLKNLEKMYSYFLDHDQTFNNRWIFNSLNLLVEKRILTNTFSDTDFYLHEHCVDFVNEEHYESSKSGVYKVKGMFYLNTNCYDDAAKYLELSLSYARRYYSYEKIADIHYHLGKTYQKLKLYEEAAEQYRMGAKHGCSNGNGSASTECNNGLFALKNSI